MSEHVLADTGHGVSHAGHHDGAVHVHALSPALLLTVFAMLLIFTVITVVVASFDFGSLNIWVAMGVATIKATLVGLYFMHLRYDNKFNLFIFLSSFVFLSLFLSFAMMDSGQYQNSIEARAQRDRDSRR
jgi:cytochrome c oxidase subunit IV